MAEYIDRERLITKFCSHCYFDVGEENCAEDCFDVKIIKSIPTADAIPLLWIQDYEEKVYPAWYRHVEAPFSEEAMADEEFCKAVDARGIIAAMCIAWREEQERG